MNPMIVKLADGNFINLAYVAYMHVEKFDDEKILHLEMSGGSWKKIYNASDVLQIEKAMEHLSTISAETMSS